jgi:hypothetical protein
LFLLPTKAGVRRVATDDSIDHVAGGFTPDVKQIVFAGNEPGKGIRLYVQDLAGGKPRAISPEGGGLPVIWVSPDGKFVQGVDAEGRRLLYPLDGGDPRPIPGIHPDEHMSGFSADSKSVFVHNFAGLPSMIIRLDLATGKRTDWKQIAPADAAGVDAIGGIGITPDEKSYVYSYSRTLSDLYVVEGLK